MTKANLMIVIFAASLLSACSTGYQSDNSWRLNGGYSETQLAEDTYTINFKGNGYTGIEKASDFTMLRAAEIGLQNGFRYFSVIENDAGFKTIYDAPEYDCTNIAGNVRCNSTGGGTIKKPRTSKTIKYYKSQPQNTTLIVYESAFVLESISKKYGIKSIADKQTP